jgi:hypothetical protein
VAQAAGQRREGSAAVRLTRARRLDRNSPSRRLARLRLPDGIQPARGDPSCGIATRSRGQSSQFSPSWPPCSWHRDARAGHGKSLYHPLSRDSRYDHHSARAPQFTSPNAPLNLLSKRPLFDAPQAWRISKRRPSSRRFQRNDAHSEGQKRFALCETAPQEFSLSFLLLRKKARKFRGATF